MPDYRKFLFTATGEDTDLSDFGIVELFDNMIAELDRLEAVTELLLCAKHEELEPRVLPGVALLLGDVRARTRVMLDLALKNAKKT